MSVFVGRMLLLCLLVSLVFTSSLSESLGASTSCHAEEAVSSPGVQLMQMQLKRPSFILGETVICSSKIGKQVPLTAAGFSSVAETCCYDDMRDFIRRTVEEDLGLQVCNEGGLNGIAPFFSCPSQPVSFSDLKSAIQSETSASGYKCHWLDALGDECTPPDPSCGISSPTTSLFKGYVGLQADSNPSALVTSLDVGDSVRSQLAQALSLPAEAVVVVMGTGPIGGTSFLQRCSSLVCTVFASYAVVQTEPPTLNVLGVADAITSMDMTQLEANIAIAVAAVAPTAGTLKLTSFRSCKENGACEDKKLRQDVTRLSEATPKPTPKPTTTKTSTPKPTPKPTTTKTSISDDCKDTASAHWCEKKKKKCSKGGDVAQKCQKTCGLCR